MKTYTLKEVMLKAKISKKTLTKYIEEMEYQVYDFDYDSNEEILFHEKDVDVIRRIKESLEHFRSTNMTISEAVNVVLSDLDKAPNEVAGAIEYDVVDLTEPPISAVELVEKIGNEFNEMKYGIFQLTEKLDDFVKEQEKIYDIIKKFEKGEASRDQILMMNFRLLQDQKEYFKKQEEKESNSFWGFFKKKEKKQP